MSQTWIENDLKYKINSVFNFYTKLILKKNNNQLLDKFKSIMYDNHFLVEENRTTVKQLSSKLERSGLVSPHWLKFSEEMEKVFFSDPMNFLSKRPFLGTISIASLPGNREISFYLKEIENNLDSNLLHYLLIDNYVGLPPIASSHYKSTFTRVQHMYQLSLYNKLTQTDLRVENIKVLEIGGGYGDLAILFHRYLQCNFTHVIIDLPVMCYIQYVYLTSILGDRVHVLMHENDKIVKNAINIVPINFLDNLSVNIDFFIATYSLTESTFNFYNAIVNKNFFNAKKFFVAHQSNNQKFIDGREIANQMRERLSLSFFHNGLENGNFLFK